ncbi:MAG: alkane 1-monooxygenase [Rhodobacteraceae bacterium]|nr:alkane 1-monooxygenase [Paracoccaceae bacterium]
MVLKHLWRALPFWASLVLVPVAVTAILHPGWSAALLPLTVWAAFALLDVFAGLNDQNPDGPEDDAGLFWYRAITLIWAPIQAALIFAAIAHVAPDAGLSFGAKLGLFMGLGVVSGTVGINYSHELMHQKNRLERGLADVLLAMVLYCHFRSEHLRVHHLWVTTPRDAVTARYNENFHRYFLRVLAHCPQSAWRAEAALLARAGRPVWHRSNPFWRYLILQVAMLALAYVCGGALGVFLFAVQAFVAVWQLELTNYVEHYGLCREHLGDGRYEPVKPHHSWNAAHRATNWLLINLQRHSDHHFKPDRRFPLLHTYRPDEAPHLPLGYPAMNLIALFPPLWRRMMNPRVRAWRRQFYPQISDWQPYTRGTNPWPRGAV